ncbi:unnamed protein product [Orchesella dallaii]|uniref:Uncharacterized protein n=1 Tax=Orchesella dallaii TaxID=48710 RepID=A0ABP1PJH9_9HEXA
MKEKLGFEPVIDKIDRLGPRKDGVHTKPRLLKVKFQFGRDRDFILKNKKRLGHPYYVSTDRTPEQRTKISKLVKNAKIAKEQGKDVDILWKTKKLKINGSVYNVDGEFISPVLSNNK